MIPAKAPALPEVFADYSAYYDLLYDDKPYGEEAKFVAGLIARYAAPLSIPRRILDLACGTGRHCFELEKLGFMVEGSDISSRMIGLAKAEAAARGSSALFHNRSFQTAHLIDQKYDAVISMFSAIDYLTTHDDLLLSLQNIHGLLVPGGLFVFDYWNGNAVVKDYSPVRELRKQKGGREIVRISRTKLDVVRQIAEVNFRFLCLADGMLQQEFHEHHRVRYFFFREIETYLQLCGFDLLHRSGFMAESLSPDDWNVTIVARKNGA